jgi:hypothetical protein
MEMEQYMDDANLDALMEEQGAESSTDTSGEASGQPGSEPSGSEEPQKEASLEDQLNDFKVEKGEDAEGDKFDPVGYANELGLLRNGMPVEFESEDQLREALSKGMDYTFKTQEHAENVKSWETQRDEEKAEIQQDRESFAAERQELEGEALASNVMLEVLQELEAEDPSAYDLVIGRFTNAMNSYNRSMNSPLVKGLEQKVGSLESAIKNFEQGKQQEENQKTIEQWEGDLTQVQSNWGPKLKALGVKPNWESVKTTWASDSGESMTVQAALMAVHGDAIAKAMESQKKLTQTKLESSRRQGGNNSNQGTTNNQSTQKPQTSLERLNGIAERLGFVS